jgi:hypothetical protein
MKPLIRLTVLAVCLLLPFSTVSFAGDKDADWDAFSKNLVKGLASQNHGLKLSAMQQIIKYSDNLQVQAGVLDILRIYRSHPDLNTRRLALTALSKTNSNMAMGFLRRAFEFEKSPVLKKQIYFIVKGHVPTAVIAQHAPADSSALVAEVNAQKDKEIQPE